MSNSFQLRDKYRAPAVISGVLRYFPEAPCTCITYRYSLHHTRPCGSWRPCASKGFSCSQLTLETLVRCPQHRAAPTVVSSVCKSSAHFSSEISEGSTQQSSICSPAQTELSCAATQKSFSRANGHQSTLQSSSMPEQSNAKGHVHLEEMDPNPSPFANHTQMIHPFTLDWSQDSAISTSNSESCSNWDLNQRLWAQFMFNIWSYFAHCNTVWRPTLLFFLSAWRHAVGWKTMFLYSQDLWFPKYIFSFLS